MVGKCDANKNAGIGTTNPTSKLHVLQQDDATNSILTIEADKGGIDNIPLTGIDFKSNDGNSSHSSTYVMQQDFKWLEFK